MHTRLASLNMLYVRSFALLLACAPLLLTAQSVEQFTAWGDASMAKEEYYGASRFYAGALALEPGRMSLQWKQAEACRLSNQYPQAIDLYAHVYGKDAGRMHPEALKWLGEMQLCDGRYKEAEETWNKVLQKEKNKKSVVAQRARNAIAGSQLAEQHSSSAPYQVEHLPAPVNTNDSEFGARSGPDSLLWFSSLRGETNKEGEVKDTASYHVQVYSSRPTAQGWSEPMAEAGPPDAMGRSNANLMWAPGGDRMYLTLFDADGSKRIATRTPDSPAQPLAGLEAHTDATQPWATELDGKAVLFFVSEGGEGGTDIWYGDLNGTTVTNIRNAGNPVNSPGNESSPSFDPVTKTLWFSSDFHAGLGGFDIFRSVHGSDVFARPENMTALNSPANDLYPVYDAASGTGWLTSNRKGSFAAKGETCCNDIYRIQGIPQRTGTPTIPSTDTVARHTPPPATEALVRLQQGFPLKLYFHNDEPEPRTRLKTTRQTYEDTYAAYRKLFGTYRSENNDPSAIDAFFTNEAEAGRAKLDALVQALIPALESGARIALDVRGHASPLAKNDYNHNLSLRRIESLRNHLYAVESGGLKAFLDSSATNGGILRLRVLPFGEDRSATGVSDDLNDLKHSVYSAEAARERRIEVERVHIGEALMPLEERMSYSLGMVRQGVPQDFEIPVVNQGDTPLHIIRGHSSCDCVMVHATPPPIPPGGKGMIRIRYSGRARPGPLERLIQLDIEDSSSPFELTIRGTVTE